MMTLVAIVGMIGVALWTARSADAHRPGLHKAGTLEAPLLHWLVYARQETNAEARSKCRARPYRAVRPAQLVPEFARRFYIQVELGRLGLYRLMSSRCFVAKAWAWYRTGSTQCVVNGEGWWTTNTGNGYYGRFQADTSFARAYNPEATRRAGPYAYSPNWTPTEQVIMGYRGFLARGYSPWPTTGRICGLL